MNTEPTNGDLQHAQRMLRRADRRYVIKAVGAERDSSFTGEKYDGNRNLAKTAKLVRADIKAATKAGELPRGIYSVRIRRYSQGQAIDVRVAKLAQPVLVMNPERVRQGDFVPSRERLHRIHSKPGREILETLEAIRRQYNRRIQDHLHFYGSAGFSGDVEREQREFIQSLDPGLRIVSRGWR